MSQEGGVAISAWEGAPDPGRCDPQTLPPTPQTPTEAMQRLSLCCEGYSRIRHSLPEILSFQSAKPPPSKNSSNVQPGLFILFIYTEVTAETVNKYCELCQQVCDKRIPSEHSLLSKEHSTD